jgi:hypothetical protein
MMCGSDYTYTPPKIFKGTLPEFWDTLHKDGMLNPDNFAIFIETVRGCKNSSCKNKCQANGKSIKKMDLQELKKILYVVRNIICPVHIIEKKECVYLYGHGDPSLYPWGKYSDYLNGTIKISAKHINKKYPDGLKIIWTCHTVEDCIAVNQSNYSERQIIVSKNIDWLEMAKISRGTVFFNSYTPSWSKNYISANKFRNGLKGFGININPIKTSKIQSGFKFVIESAKINEANIIIIARRCIQPDSGKVKFKIPLCLQKSDKYDSYDLWINQKSQHVAKALLKLLKMKTDCEKCTKVVWRAKVNL